MFRCSIIIAALLWNSASAYNVETSQTFSLYLRNGGADGGSTGNQEPAYAGYSFDVTLENDVASIIVGQPRSGEPDRAESPGAIYQCNFTYLGADQQTNESTTMSDIPTTAPANTTGIPLTMTSSYTTGRSLTMTSSNITGEPSTISPTTPPLVKTSRPIEAYQTSASNDATTSPTFPYTTAAVIERATTVTVGNIAEMPDFSSPNCTKIIIFDPTVRSQIGADHTVTADALGLSIGKLGNTKQYAVCTPLRQRVCPSNSYAPGACYIGDPQHNFWEYKTWNETACFTSTIDLIFVVDGSKSIGIGNFNIVKQWLVNVTRDLIRTYGDAVRTEVLQYSDQDQPWLK